MTPLLHRYLYRVTRAPGDSGELVATCAELPSLSWLDSGHAAALRGIVDLVTDYLDNLGPDETPPVPFAERVYSGEIRVRIPPATHERLAKEAAASGVSLNTIIVQKLSAP